jgi:hypothetical protein
MSTDSFGVDPLIPFTLLEAVRDLDRPEGAAEAEYVPEMLNKRLGTHETVYIQIRRYADAMRRGVPIDSGEVSGLARLIARRPDAVDVFRAAGAAMARTAYTRIPGPVRGLIRVLPNFAARPWARRRARKIVARYYGATLERYGAALRMRLPDRRVLIADGNERDPGATYYDAGLQELLTLLALH